MFLLRWLSVLAELMPGEYAKCKRSEDVVVCSLRPEDGLKQLGESAATQIEPPALPLVGWERVRTKQKIETGSPD
jgi:hypothetical protein